MFTRAEFVACCVVVEVLSRECGTKLARLACLGRLCGVEWLVWSWREWLSTKNRCNAVHNVNFKLTVLVAAVSSWGW